MTWKIELKNNAVKSLNKLDKPIRDRIYVFLTSLKDSHNPRAQGKALTGKYSGCWRYRIGEYRLICRIEDKTVTVLVLDIGHRKHIYAQH
jgi:mRNA interferase RelE/StbE